MFIACLVVLLGIACVDIQGPEREALSPSEIFSQVKINSSAIMIAKGDSHSIAVGVYAMSGSSIPIDPDSIQWSSSDAQTVRVSSTGTIYGLKVSSSPVQVIVSYKHKYVTKSDTANVYVTDSVIDANAIRLVSLDSNRVGFLGALLPRVRVDLYKGTERVEYGALAIPVQVDQPASELMDITGGPDNDPVYLITNFRSLIGKFWVRASLNLYGNEVSDSIPFTGLYPGARGVLVSALPAEQVASTTILDTLPLNLYQPCSVITITNQSADTIDVVFSDSTASSVHCAGAPSLLIFPFPYLGSFIGGNILSLPPSYVAQRQSATRGIIVYRIRKSSTKEFLPYFTGHYKQLEPDE